MLKTESEYASPDTIIQKYYHLNNNGVVIPLTEFIPPQQKTATPVLLAPGWGATDQSIGIFGKTFAQKNWRVIAPAYPSEKLLFIPSALNSVQRYFQTPDGNTYKAAILLAVINQLSINRVHVIAHSEGAINATIAAAAAPEAIASLTLVSPAGVLGKDTLIKLVMRLGANGLIETLQSNSVAERQNLRITRLASRRSFLTNPLQSIKAGYHMAWYRIHHILKHLHEKGIVIFILPGQDDIVFPTKQIDETTEQEVHYKKFIPVAGSHNRLLTAPEQHATTIDTLLTNLANDG